MNESQPIGNVGFVNVSFL